MRTPSAPTPASGFLRNKLSHPRSSDAPLRGRQSASPNRVHDKLPLDSHVRIEQSGIQELGHAFAGCRSCLSFLLDG